MSESIAIIIIEEDPPNPYEITPGIASGQGFYAYVAANPNIRSSGSTEQEALARIKAQIISIGRGGKKKIVELRFDELIVEEIMNS